jgi:DnaK suppressor protein
MATAAKKPTPKTQKAATAKATATAVKPAPKLMTVSGKTAPAAKSVPAKTATAKGGDDKVPAAKVAAKPTAAKTPATKTAAVKTAKPAKPAPTEPGSVSMLTDEDILRMPEEDYMNEVQLQFFKAKLLAMRAEILDNARETGEHLKENEVFADPNDRATVEEENMLEQRVRDRERKLLKKIEQSLARIESGEYGYCLETGEPIGIPRLLARPTAELSIEAQEKHERMERLYAD